MDYYRNGLSKLERTPNNVKADFLTFCHGIFFKISSCSPTGFTISMGLKQAVLYRFALFAKLSAKKQAPLKMHQT